MHTCSYRHQDDDPGAFSCGTIPSGHGVFTSLSSFAVVNKSQFVLFNQLVLLAYFQANDANGAFNLKKVPQKYMKVLLGGKVDLHGYLNLADAMFTHASRFI
jgi:hypothetical protein